MRGIRYRSLLELVVEALALGDLERLTKPLVVGTETKQPADQRLVGAVPFTGPGKGAVKLKESPLGSSAYQPARQQAQSAGTGCVRRRGADHHGADNVKQRDHA